jgi:pyrroline-5-carboxylate reductase
MSANYKIGILGLGNMGFPIYEALRQKYFIIPYDPYVVEKYPKISFASSIEEIDQTTQVIILAVKPNKVVEVLREFQKPKTFLSIAAGISIETLAQHSPEGSTYVRLMPNMPIIVKEGAIGMYGDRAGYSLARELFSHLGEIIEVSSEDLMDAVTGVSGSSPAFVVSFIHGLAEGGVKAGLSYQDSLDLVLQTVKGTCILLEEARKKNPHLHPISFRNSVTSPGGTTIYGLEKLEEGGFHSLLMKAVFTAAQRASELGKKK